MTVTPRVGLALSAALFGMSASTIQQTLLATATPTIIAELGHPSAYSGVAGLYVLASTAVLPWAGVVTDRLGARTMYLVGIGVFALGTIEVCVSTTMAALLIARLMQGMGAGLLVPAALAVVSLVQGDRARGRAFGLMGMAQVASNVIGPVWGGWATDTVGWRWGVAATVPLILTGSSLAAFSMPSNRRGREWWRITPKDLALPRQHEARALCAVAFLIGGVTVATMTYLPWVLHARHQLSAGAIGRLLIPMLLASAAGSAAGGALVSHERALRSCWIVLSCSAALMAVPGLLPLSVGAAGVGFSCGAGLPIVLTRIQAAADKCHVAAASSLVQLARHAGAAVIVPAFGIWPAALSTNPACLGLFVSLLTVAMTGLLISWRTT